MRLTRARVQMISSFTSVVVTGFLTQGFTSTSTLLPGECSTDPMLRTESRTAR
jgi:hypothetical protein